MSTPWDDVSRDLDAALLAMQDAARGDEALSADPGPFRAERELAVGKRLHDAFSATEAAVVRLLRTVDGDLPTGGRWHQDVLARAAAPRDGLRPAILSRDTADLLNKLAGFRHAFRNVYARFVYRFARENVAWTEEAIPRAAAEIEDFARAIGILDPGTPRRFPHPA